MINAIAYIEPMKKGKSKPLLFQCDDGRDYVVKTMSNPNHGDARKILANDYIANKLAEYLKLPVAEGQIIYLSQEVIDQIPVIENYDIQPGMHFGCIFYKNKERPTRPERNQKCINLNEMPGIIVFDHWVRNRDRADNQWNLIVDIREDDNKLYMIDHGGCFFSSRRSATSLRKYAGRMSVYWGKLYKQFKYFIKDKAAFDHYLKAIEEFPDEEINNIVYSTPAEWEPDQDELDAIIEYLIIRKTKLQEPIYKILRRHLRILPPE